MADPDGASWELQKAVVQRLAQDTGLRAAMGLTGSTPAPVLDHVPENQAMPYVEWDDGTVAEWDTGKVDGEDGAEVMQYGAEHTFRLYAYSSYEGRKQAKAMNRAIERSLRDAEAELELNGHRVVNIRVTSSYTLRDTDMQAYYGAVSVRAVTEEL